MRKLCYCLLQILLSSFFVNTANAQLYQWSNTFGGIQGDGGSNITVDDLGNLYTIGGFSGQVDFDPGPGMLMLTSISNTDLFILKSDPTGNTIWAKQLVGTGTGIKIDSFNNIYISGSFKGIVDFDPGPGVNSMAALGNEDMYILKLDTSGSFLWAEQISGTNEIFPTSMTLDEMGNLYFVGQFKDTVDFDPGPSTFLLYGSGGIEGFILKLNSSGSFEWAGVFDGTGNKYVNTIFSDNFGHVNIAGRFYGSVDFDINSNVFILSSVGSQNTFICQYDTNGNLNWAKHFAGGYNTGSAICSDGNGNIITTGTFSGTTDFDPGSGVANLSGGVYQNVYISKLDIDGNFIWIKTFTGTGQSYVTYVITDNIGNIYITGYYSATSDFNPGMGTYYLTASYFDIFISKLKADGGFSWAKSIGHNDFDQGNCLAVDSNNDLFAVGNFHGTAFFNPPNGGALTSNGLSDCFIAKYDNCTSATYNTIFEIACGSYDSPSGNYIWTTSGVYIDTIPNSSSCDSIITVNLTILPFTPPIITGIDSICQGSYSNLTTTIPYLNYVWSTGDTISAISTGTAGVYSVIVTASNGCMDTAFFLLTVVQYPTVTINALGQTTFCQGDSVVLAANSGSTTYQWYRRNYAIPGATSVNYIAKSAGRYMCIAQNAALCSDTSNFIIVNVPCIQLGPNHERVEPPEVFVNDGLIIYPNPGDGIFTILSDLGTLQIFNVVGELVYSNDIFEEQTTIDISNFRAGYYIVKIHTSKAVVTRKITLSGN